MDTTPELVFRESTSSESRRLPTAVRTKQLASCVSLQASSLTAVNVIHRSTLHHFAITAALVIANWGILFFS